MKKLAHRFFPLSVALLAALSVGRTAEPEAAPDPWNGKMRSDLVTLLGEPDKIKQGEAGGSVLIYKLSRLEEGGIAPLSMITLDVPGVGIVARSREAVLRSGPDVSMEPTAVDEYGRSTGGGLTEQRDSSISWEDGKKSVTDPGEDRSAIRGKLTLKVEVDGSGTIRSWSVSPKKAASPK